MTLPTETLLIEVKCTTGNDTQFELGETEVRRAQALLPRERYVILFLDHVLDPANCTMRVLPNPFQHGGLTS